MVENGPQCEVTWSDFLKWPRGSMVSWKEWEHYQLLWGGLEGSVGEEASQQSWIEKIVEGVPEDGTEIHPFIQQTFIEGLPFSRW